MALASFNGLRVLSLESRRAREIAQLIINNGGEPLVAPSTREIPSESNPVELKFAASLLQDQFDVVIFLTGVGTRALAQAVEPVCSREQFVAALSRTTIIIPRPQTRCRAARVRRAHRSDRSRAQHLARNLAGS